MSNKELMLCPKCKEEFKQDIEKVINAIISKPVEKPVMYFKYPPRKKFTIKDFATWFENLELYYNMAQRYEKQERTHVLCVDRAFHNYLMPELVKMLNFLTEGKK